MAYLDELAAVTAAREEFNERTRRLHESRGVPTNVPIVATLNDAEVMQYLADGEALLERERALHEKYFQPGVDPHTVD